MQTRAGRPRKRALGLKRGADPSVRATTLNTRAFLRSPNLATAGQPSQTPRSLLQVELSRRSRLDSKMRAVGCH